MTELIPLATCAGFALFERKGFGSNGWRSLKLVRNPREAGQNSWHLGWNGTRMARNTDAVKLIEDHPETMQWVIDSLRAGGDRKSEARADQGSETILIGRGETAS